MWPSVLVEDLQQGPGAQPVLTAEASQLGDAGGVLAQENSEEAAGGREADAFGLGGTGEFGLPIRADNHAQTLGCFEGFHPNAQFIDLLLQAVDLLLVVFALQITNDRFGLPIQRLPGDVAISGMLSDVAMRAEENDGGAGQAIRGSYDAHGVDTCGNAVGGSSALLQELTPLLSAPPTDFSPFSRKSRSTFWRDAIKT
jgi:hypothetical protein